MIDEKKAISIFYSYSHKDEKLRDKLDTHLSLMKREGTISSWHDRKISAGKEWVGEIDEHINSAQIILLLVSSDFMNSDYCYDIEMRRALERHDLGEACVIPIILRPCDWHNALFGKLEVLPINGKPVISRSWHSQDEALLNIATGIRNIIKEIGEKELTTKPLQVTKAKDLNISTHELAKITDKKHILFVDDNIYINNIYKYFSEYYGFYVTSLLDGKEALDFTERIFVDVIVLDLMMLRIGGLEFIEQFRKRSNNTPIIVVSHASKIAQENAIRLGANKVLSKPFQPTYLLKEINNLLIAEKEV